MKKLLFIILIFALSTAVASATPLCTNVVTTAATFQAQGNVGCQFGDKIFYDFTYSYTVEDSTGAVISTTAVPGTAVTVQFSNLGGIPTQPVVTFLANWDAKYGQQGDVRITYNVTAPPDLAMVAATLGLTGYVSNVSPTDQRKSYISGAESICCPGPGNSVDHMGLTLTPPRTGTAGLVLESGNTQVDFAAATQISISKDILILAGTNTGGTPPTGNEATLTRIDQGLIEDPPATPEPASLLLAALGIAPLVYLKRRSGKTNSPVERHEKHPV